MGKDGSQQILELPSRQPTCHSSPLFMSIQFSIIAANIEECSHIRNPGAHPPAVKSGLCQSV